MNDCCWSTWHKAIAETEKRIRDYEVKPLQRQYDMIARTLDAVHTELGELRKLNSRRRWWEVKHAEDCNIKVLGANPLTIDGDCTCGAVNHNG